MPSLQFLGDAPPAMALAVAAPAVAYLMLLAVAVLVATLHPQPDRRADARRVLVALLAVVRSRRGR
ncbi:hypothetical protein AB0J86_25515 [Micromonospora sp. NPDC049559]|uniref:hypothetical protein n=1 Tax=Micromonospora sp. NPDC049559 TaxID=3155923 RepID=UPI003446B899